MVKDDESVQPWSKGIIYCRVSISTTASNLLGSLSSWNNGQKDRKHWAAEAALLSTLSSSTPYIVRQITRFVHAVIDIIKFSEYLRVWSNFDIVFPRSPFLRYLNICLKYGTYVFTGTVPLHWSKLQKITAIARVNSKVINLGNWIAFWPNILCFYVEIKVIPRKFLVTSLFSILCYAGIIRKYSCVHCTSYSSLAYYCHICTIMMDRYLT